MLKIKPITDHKPVGYFKASKGNGHRHDAAGRFVQQGAQTQTARLIFVRDAVELKKTGELLFGSVGESILPPVFSLWIS